MWECPYTICVYRVALVEDSYLMWAWLMSSYRICWEQSPSISWMISPPTNHLGRRHGCRWSGYSQSQVWVTKQEGLRHVLSMGWLACWMVSASEFWTASDSLPPVTARNGWPCLLGYHSGSELAIQQWIFFSWGSLHSSMELCSEQVILSGYSTWAGEHIGVVTEIQLGFQAVSVCFLPFSRVKYVCSSWVEPRLTAMLSVPLVLKLTKGIYPTSVWPQGWATQ